jgi:hypothetical protein
MTTVPAAVLTELQQRRGVIARTLYWFTGRDRATGAPASLGLWTGDDARVIDIDGQARTYYGPAVLQGDPLRLTLGLSVPSIRLTLADIRDEVVQAVRVYDARGATVQIHAVLFDLDSGAQIATPFQVFRGRLDRLTFSTGAIGDDGVATSAAEMEIVPETDFLTRPLPAYRSDADQRAIYPGDGFFRHAATAATAEVVVGERKVRASDNGSGGTGARSGGGIVISSGEMP